MMFAVPKRGPKRGRHAHLVALPLYIAAGCGDPADPPVEDSGDATTAATGSSGGTGTSSTGGDASTAAPTSTTEPTTGGTGGATSDETTGDASSTGPASCVKNVVLMGYWPPTNEMLRPWSTDPTQNPGGWIGEDWGGHGYDVHAFFPEFPPDGDPSNDKIGDDGAVGSPDYDLRVDYQATSADFWRLVDTYQPVILLTTSRGGKIGWEIEALEGGHGMGKPGDPAMDWVSDGYGDDHFPSEATIEPRSWAAISTYRQGNTRSSSCGRCSGPSTTRSRRCRWSAACTSSRRSPRSATACCWPTGPWSTSLASAGRRSSTSMRTSRTRPTPCASARA